MGVYVNYFQQHISVYCSSYWDIVYIFRIGCNDYQYASGSLSNDIRDNCYSFYGTVFYVYDVRLYILVLNVSIHSRICYVCN